MNTVARSRTVHFVRRKDEDEDDYDQYYHLYQRRETTTGNSPQNHGWRIFSRRRSVRTQKLMSSCSHRRERARKRHIFLQTYKLGAISAREKLIGSRKLKKMVVKVKTAVVAVLAFMRGGALRSCGQRSAIRAAPPLRIPKLC